MSEQHLWHSWEEQSNSPSGLRLDYEPQPEKGGVHVVQISSYLERLAGDKGSNTLWVFDAQTGQ